jgi:hypothetical protein
MLFRKRIFLRLAVAAILLLCQSRHALAYPPELTAQVQASPALITLNWPSVNGATNYVIYRTTTIGGYAGGGGSWGTPIATLDASATSFADDTVSAGTEYEYNVWVGGLTGTNLAFADNAYIYCGIQVPLVENRGKIVLLVDSAFSFDLAFELDRLQRDLAGDGWTVLRHDVSRDSAPPDVKAVIQSEYAADPANVTAVFLLGHIPIAYSGWIHPDHHPQRPGPTDTFYGDMHGAWTDTLNLGDNTINNFYWWINVAGDGKFDQSSLPADVDLQVGRVDFYDMPSFQTNGLYEEDLLRQYLNRDHDFRAGNFTVANQGATMTSQNGDYCMSQFFGLTPGFDFDQDSSFEIPLNSYFSEVESTSYLWFTKGTGGGEYTSDISIGDTGDFASAANVQVVFNAFFASYYWEWDVTDSFLRAPLAANGYGLVNLWADQPCWALQHMALGKNIGYSARLSQNNSGYYNMVGFFGTGNRRSVHLSLMGDPTLRMHVVQPPSNLLVFPNGNQTTLRWARSPQANILGYNAYRAGSPAGPFTRLNSNYVTGNVFVDANPPAGTNYYLLRAVNLDASSGSGTYLNASDGVFDQKGPRVLAANAPSGTQVRVVFDKALDAASSQNAANYSLSAGGVVSSATLESNGHSVLLAISQLADGVTYGVTVNGVMDTFANAVAANTAASFMYSPIPEYVPDTNTIALWHLNGDGTDASGNGYTLTLNGGAAFAQSSPVGASPQCLRVFNVNDYATVNVPGNVIMPDGGQPFTLEARIYVNEWKSYSIGDYDLISAYQNYDSYFRYAQGIWDLPANGSFDSSQAVLVDALPAHSLIKLGEWYHIAMVFDGTNNVSVYINGVLAGGPANNPPNFGESLPFVITLGSFDGYIDEVRLSSVARDFVLQDGAPASLTASAMSPSQINLAWTDVPDEIGFAVERWDGGNAGFVPVATTAAGVTTFSDSTLASSTLYTYRVRALGATGVSQYSPQAAATTQPVQQALGNGPKLTPLGFTGAGNFMLHVAATTNIPYYVQSSVDLTNWGNIFTNQNGGALEFTDPAVKTVKRYYRTAQ